MKNPSVNIYVCDICIYYNYYILQIYVNKNKI